ncbi:hypothetical protein CPB84DRAFT_1794423 [Gymnopilus junonius]|uniref:Secreted protein n=1 Tax=Gymnopilus junonius TaxID=109634 RepID=A0A9P5TGI6_GYMJU|nr:hypothetical protein CPB84DRAFT_1794423 [Gymnopilus junonius]
MQVILTNLFSLAAFVWATHLHPSHPVLSVLPCLVPRIVFANILYIPPFFLPADARCGTMDSLGTGWTISTWKFEKS